MKDSEKVHESNLRSRLVSAAEESKSPVRPAVGLWRSLYNVITGPPRETPVDSPHEPLQEEDKPALKHTVAR